MALRWPSRRTFRPSQTWADTLGLDTIVSGLDRYTDAMGPGFKFSELLRQKARAKETFVWCLGGAGMSVAVLT